MKKLFLGFLALGCLAFIGDIGVAAPAKLKPLKEKPVARMSVDFAKPISPESNTAQLSNSQFIGAMAKIGISSDAFELLSPVRISARHSGSTNYGLTLTQPEFFSTYDDKIMLMDKSHMKSSWGDLSIWYVKFPNQGQAFHCSVDFGNKYIVSYNGVNEMIVTPDGGFINFIVPKEAKAYGNGFINVNFIAEKGSYLDAWQFNYCDISPVKY